MQRNSAIKLMRWVGRRPQIIWMGSLGVAFLVMVLATFVLLEARADAFERASEAAANLALTVAGDTSRNLEIYDLSLQGAVEALSLPAVQALPQEIQQLVLFDRSATAKELGSILVLDEAGNVVADSRQSPPRKVNLADRDYFKVQRASSDAGLYMSRPFLSRVTQAESIGLSRRISHADGSFAGVVVGTLRIDYFREMFADLNVGSGAAMSLYLSDGTLISRRPAIATAGALNISSSAVFQRMLNSPNGAFAGVAVTDGVERWYSYRHIKGFPMIIAVAPSMDDIYATWRRRAWLIGSLMAALAVMIVGVSVLFSGELKRRLSIEHDLLALARTDGLTKLGNRRAFDEAAALEWRRALRLRQPLSLILIDIDHFKAFNDMYGHTAGDEALAVVARCIENCVHRPGDMSARYGGEEFVILLPNTTLDGGAKIGEDIRIAIENQAVTHAGSAHAVLTISVGVSSTETDDHRSFKAMLNAADAALYEAKDGGRNRVKRFKRSLGLVIA